MAATTTSILTSSSQALYASRSISSSSNGTPSVSTTFASNFIGVSLRRHVPTRRKGLKTSGKISAVATATATAAVVETTPSEEVKEFTLPTWAQFELGKASVFWKTMNGLPPTPGENLRLFYNPAASKLVPNDEFGIAFNGGFNQPIMCGGEPRAMRKKSRGKADSPIYSIQICIPKHARNLIFSFTNGDEWDGPYRLQFEVPRAWRNKPIDFFNKGIAEELSKDGACDRAIFPDTDIVITRCAMIGNLTLEGGDRCNLDLVLGCLDPSSPSYNPLANVDDGSCPLDADDEE